jgi:hypothetical protein
MPCQTAPILVRDAMLVEPDGHLVGVGRFAHRLQPGPARAEHVMGNQADRERVIAAAASADHVTTRTGIGVPRMARRSGALSLPNL